MACNPRAQDAGRDRKPPGECKPGGASAYIEALSRKVEAEALMRRRVQEQNLGKEYKEAIVRIASQLPGTGGGAEAPVPAANPRTPKPPGRPGGTGYEEKDAPLIEKMQQLRKDKKAKSWSDAASMVVGEHGEKAEGWGSREAKIDRLVKRAGITENN